MFIVYSIAGCVVGSDVAADAVSATNDYTTSSSARERIIQSVGVHLL